MKTYIPSTLTENTPTGKKYYPVIKFTFKGISDSYILVKDVQKSRSKALTFAKNYIKNLKD